MKGAQRVVTFCLLIAVVPVILLAIPLYLRHSLYKDVTYVVSESDILEIVNGMSSIFCQGHSLRMDSPFSAFQVKGPPVLSTHHRKHIHLKKSMALPDDTLEYWGFYLPNGSTVYLSVCSRFDGSRILVVKGEKELRDCGLTQPEEVTPTHISKDEGGVFVTYESGMFTAKVKNQPDGEEENHGGEIEDENPEQVLSVGNKESRLGSLANQLNGITKRSPEERQLDGGVAHGGLEPPFGHHRLNDSSASSFESSLLTCYDGRILLSQGFAPSKQCTSPDYLESGGYLSTTHNVTSDGYYFYIFYSDNDYVRNDIHAVFDIHKPTFLYNNYTSACVNTTECTFPVIFLSEEIVVIEVPTRDGIEHQADDNHILISTCHPRTLIYAVFPITVLLLVLLCAFL